MPETVRPCDFCKRDFTAKRASTLYCSRKCKSCADYKPSIATASGGPGGVDHNQKVIVDTLRRIGASVFIASDVGEGFPDLVVGFRKTTFLLEVKNPDTNYGNKGLNDNQRDFARAWRGGDVKEVRSANEALAAIGLKPLNVARS